MASILDRGTIISEGLELGGNPGIAARARVFLNILLDHLYRAHDWDFLEKDTAVTATQGTETISLASITDFRTPTGLRFTDDSVALKLVAWRDIWNLVEADKDKSPPPEGVPTMYAFDRDANQLILYPIPNKTRAGKLRYLRLPIQPAVTPIATYDALFPEFEDAYALVSAIAEFAKFFDQESAVLLATRLTEVLIGEAKRADVSGGRANSNQLHFDSTVHRIFRDS